MYLGYGIALALYSEISPGNIIIKDENRVSVRVQIV